MQKFGPQRESALAPNVDAPTLQFPDPMDILGPSLGPAAASETHYQVIGHLGGINPFQAARSAEVCPLPHPEILPAKREHDRTKEQAVPQIRMENLRCCEFG